MQRDYLTLEKFEKMFLRQPDGFAYCKLCNQEIMLLDSDEVEFWRHQVDREHLDCLINFYLSQENDLLGKKRKPPLEINNIQYRDKNMNKLEKQMQKEAKRMMKTQQGNNQMKQIVDQLDQLMLQKFTNDDMIRRVKYSFSSSYPYETNDDNNLESALTFKQQYKKQKKLDQSQESFSQLVEDHFNNFILELIKKQQLTEASCFLLARIGISSKQICEINFATIYWEIDELFGNCKDLPQIILVLNVLKEVAAKLEQDVSEKNKGFLIRQPKKPKELRKKLESLRKSMKNEIACKDYKRFLERLKVKSLNAIFKSEMKNQMPILKKGLPSDQVKKELNEIYIDISNEEEDDGSLVAEDQSGIFHGNESNPYREQQQLQDQQLSENQSVPLQGNQTDQAYLERVIEIIQEYEQQRIKQKQQKNLQESNLNMNQKKLDQFDYNNQEWNEKELSNKQSEQ